MAVTTYTVEGMTCGHCVASITEEVQEVSGVERVVVSLDSKQMTVEGSDVQNDAVLAAVTEAGYSATPNG